MSRSLRELLNVLHKSDNEIELFSNSELKSTIGEVKDKVDNLKEVINFMEADAERFQRQEILFAAKKRTTINGIKRLKEYVAFVMLQNETDKLQGNIYYISLQKKNTLKHNERGLSVKDISDLIYRYGDDIVSVKLNASYAKKVMDEADKPRFFNDNESVSAIFRVKKI